MGKNPMEDDINGRQPQKKMTTLACLASKPIVFWAWPSSALACFPFVSTNTFFSPEGSFSISSFLSYCRCYIQNSDTIEDEGVYTTSNDVSDIYLEFDNSIYNDEGDVFTDFMNNQIDH